MNKLLLTVILIIANAIVFKVSFVLGCLMLISEAFIIGDALVFHIRNSRGATR